MEQTFGVEEITVGFHPDGYRIDKTAPPMDWYTKLDVEPGHPWSDPRPVPFDALPKKGWFGIDRFDWQRTHHYAEQF